jgi:hypothetical protein
MEKGEIKNYGLKLRELEDFAAYKLGGIELPKEVLVSDGNWEKYLPSEESQITPSFDTYGCTVYGTENIQQILENYYFGKTNEYAERYIYNLAKITPPGADPHDIAESFRQNGVIPYGLLPMTSTLEEYAKPRPVPSNLISQGIAHHYELRHQYLWQRPVSKEERTKLIKEYLKYSPLAVSVTAWLNRDGVYIDNGQRNTHWTVLYNWNDKGWLIFDSYSPHRKILSYDHNIEVCKRYTLVVSTRKEQLSILSKILQLISSWLGMIEPKGQTPILEPKSEVKPEPKPEPKVSVTDFANAIEHFEGYYPPSSKYPNGSVSWRNRNPGNLKNKKGQFIKYATYDEGYYALCDYIKRVGKNEHKAYPKDCDIFQFFSVYAPTIDGNHPRDYSVWIAQRLNIYPQFKIKDLSGIM